MYAMRDEGSFRDPSGYVYHLEGRTYRTISASAASDYCFVRDSGFLEDLSNDGSIVGC